MRLARSGDRWTAPKFKDYILPLIFLKRLSDVFEDEFGRLVEDIGDEEVALEVVEGDRKAVRFYVPQKARWAQIRQKTTGLGEYLTDAVRAVARENPRFHTAREVGVLLARLLDPEPGMEAYDPCCGSAGLLIKCHLRLLETHGQQVNDHRELPSHDAPLKLYGQEINPSTFAMAKMNSAIREMQDEIVLGDTMNHPAFRDEGGHLERFDLIAANPMWNQKFPTEVYEHDPYERFEYGVPPSSSADWGWVQHMASSLKEGGRGRGARHGSGEPVLRSVCRRVRSPRPYLAVLP
jgi:type I restriction-modification system DNA methylase subunit